MKNKLFHFTTVGSLVDILRMDTMRSFSLIAPGELKNYEMKPYIPFTRNKELLWRGNVRIVFNKNLLRNNYKIIPFDFFGKLPEEAVNYYTKNGIDRDQMEEIIITKEINNITKYIINIDLHSLEKIDYEDILSLIKQFYNGEINLYSDYLKTKICQNSF